MAFNCLSSQITQVMLGICPQLGTKLIIGFRYITLWNQKTVTTFWIVNAPQ